MVDLEAQLQASQQEVVALSFHNSGLETDNEKLMERVRELELQLQHLSGDVDHHERLHEARASVLEQGERFRQVSRKWHADAVQTLSKGVQVSLVDCGVGRGSAVPQPHAEPCLDANHLCSGASCTAGVAPAGRRGRAPVAVAANHVQRRVVGPPPQQVVAAVIQRRARARQRRRRGIVALAAARDERLAAHVGGREPSPGGTVAAACARLVRWCARPLDAGSPRGRERCAAAGRGVCGPRG